MLTITELYKLYIRISTISENIGDSLYAKKDPKIFTYGKIKLD